MRARSIAEKSNGDRAGAMAPCHRRKPGPPTRGLCALGRPKPERPTSETERNVRRLIGKPDAQLQLPWRAHHTGDPSDGGRRVDGHRGIAKIDVVEHVERLEANHQIP